MKFCERCGSFMERTAKGFTCPKCGEEVHIESIEVRRTRKPPPETVYIVGNAEDKAPTVSQICPQCGNNEAYRMVYSAQGEHAGVKQDRTVERFRCTECHHTWTRS